MIFSVSLTNNKDVKQILKGVGKWMVKDLLIQSKNWKLKALEKH
jgi:hypothetical protein